MIKTKFSELFNLDMPVIMAPMFLVSNESMIKSAVKNGIIGTFPTLNFRSDNELDKILNSLNDFKNKEKHKGTYGVNIITQKSNPLYKKHLNICVKNKVPFYITSLGNPKEVISKAHEYGAKVFCDVTNLKHAEKAVKAGADGIIAVGSGAGGHAGNEPLQILIPALKEEFPETIIIAAGGIVTGRALHSILVLGADGASIGTSFIATEESPVSEEYKKAVIKAKSEDIVMTERISGTPASVINTEYARKIGYKQNFFEKILSKNPKTKKYFKMLVQVKGMKKLEKAVKPGNYKNLWIAGKSAHFVNEIKTVEELITDLRLQTENSILNNSITIS